MGTISDASSSRGLQNALLALAVVIVLGRASPVLAAGGRLFALAFFGLVALAPAAATGCFDPRCQAIQTTNRLSTNRSTHTAEDVLRFLAPVRAACVGGFGTGAIAFVLAQAAFPGRFASRCRFVQRTDPFVAKIRGFLLFVLFGRR